MALDPRTARQNAINKANRLGWHKHAEQFTASRWVVASTTSRSTYYVVINHGRGRWSCRCRAGEMGSPCVHAAAAWVASLRDQAGRSN